MTIPFAVADFPVLILPGLFFLLFGTWQAVRQRENLKRLVCWGALVDAGVVCLALGCGGMTARLVAFLYVPFQAAARLLALAALADLSHGAAPALSALRGAGKTRPAAGTLFALGLMASVGGSPFFVPEARLFLANALLQAGLPGYTGFGLCLLTAACTLVLLALHLHTVQITLLEAPYAHAAPLAPRKPGLPALALTIVIAVLGLARNELISFFARFMELGEIRHTLPHISFWLFYAGALLGGAGCLCRNRFAPWAVVLTSALALISVVLFPPQLAAFKALPLIFLTLICLVAVVVSLYSLDYMAHDDHPARYWFFLPLTFAALAGIVTSPNADAFYGYWELMTFASYFLVVHEGRRAAYDAGFKYYLMCAGGAFLLLPGLTLLCGGAMSLPYSLVAHVPDHVFKMGLVCCLIGFAVKAGLVPLHSWLPDAHPAAPSSVSGPLSGIITKMGIYGLLLLGLLASARPQEGLYGLNWYGTALVFMGAFTLVYGEIMALRQQDIKRMLAFSTLGQLGEIALVLGVGTLPALYAVLAHVSMHAVMKDLLFLGVGALILRAGSRQLADLRGLGRAMPWTVSCMCVGLITIMGLPPFGGFLSKYLMIKAMTQAGHVWLAALILAGSLVGAVYYIRILRTLVFEERPAHLPAVTEAPLFMRLALLILAVLCLVPGLAPWLADWLAGSLLYGKFIPLPLGDTAEANIGPILTGLVPLMMLDIPAFLMSGNIWPLYVAVPVFGALLPALFRRDARKAGLAALAVLLLTVVLVLAQGRQLDALSFGFALLVPCMGALNVIYALGYMSHSHSQWRFYCAFTAMCGGLVGMAAAPTLFSFFLFWEIMSAWTLYLALAHEGDALSLREAFKYFCFNVCGAGFIFVGVCCLSGNLPMSVSPETLGELTRQLERLGRKSELPFALGFCLLGVGFLMKAAQLPFRIDWQMHPAVAPTPVSGFISSVLLKSSIFGLVKLFLLLGGAALTVNNLVSPETLAWARLVAMWIGGVTIVYAALQALRANQVKLVFIYSTVSQIGYMVLAVAAGGALGYAGGLLHVINHVFFKDLLFLVCGAVMFATHCETLEDLGGLGRKMPFTLAMFAIAGLSVVGVPPTSGFSSKWLIYHALMEADQPLLALLSLVGSVITLAYVAKFLHAAFLGQPSPHLDHVSEAPSVMRAPMLVLALGCLVTGIFPGLALWPINQVLQEYGLETLRISPAGISEGPGAWNATGMAVMLALAVGGGLLFVKRFVRLREVDIHTCGLPPETATSRMKPASIYGGFVRLLGHLPGAPDPAQGERACKEPEA